MILSIFSKIISAFLRTNIAKSSNAKTAAENTQAEASGTAESAPNVSENKRLSEDLMTVEGAKTILKDWCMSQVGYHEALDGSNKYADGVWDVKLYGFDATNVPWCDVFVDYAFIHCFGYDDATKMTYQTPAGYAACKLSADAYKQHGAFYKKPEVGDQIFFLYGGDINHTGIVVGVDGDSIKCVEGNYSDSVGLTRYNLRNSYSIAGYGRPDWSVVADEPAPDVGNFDDVDDTPVDIVHPENRISFLHLEYGDGDGNPLPQVKAWQNLLLCWGFDIGIYGADGEFGYDTENATRQWQLKAKERGADVEVNGVVDEDDWVTIVEVPV